MPYAIGETILGIFAIFIRDYVTLQWVMSVICFIQVCITVINCYCDRHGLAGMSDPGAAHPSSGLLLQSVQ